jgi:hypothetical protein
MSQFDHPVGSFEYELHEEMIRVGFLPVSPAVREAIVEIASIVYQRVEVDAKVTAAQQAADSEAAQTISVTATRIQEQCEALDEVVKEAIAQLSVAYADVVKTVHEKLGAVGDRIEDIVGEVV